MPMAATHLHSLTWKRNTPTLSVVIMHANWSKLGAQQSQSRLSSTLTLSHISP